MTSNCIWSTSCPGNIICEYLKPFICVHLTPKEHIILNPFIFFYVRLRLSLKEHNYKKHFICVHLTPKEHIILNPFIFFYVWLRLSLKEHNYNTSYHKICPTLCYIPKQWLVNVYNLLYFFNGRYNCLKCLWRCTIVDYDFGNDFRQNLPK